MREQGLFPLLKVCSFIFYEALSRALFHLILTTSIFISILQIRETDTGRLIDLLEATVIEQLLTQNPYYCTPPPPPIGDQEQNSY